MVRKDRAERERQWLDRFERQGSSGLSVASFCEREGISSVSFYLWRKRLRPTPQPKAVRGEHAVSKNPPFLPVTIKDNSETIEIELPNHVVVRLPATVGSDFLAKVIQATDISLREQQGC